MSKTEPTSGPEVSKLRVEGFGFGVRGLGGSLLSCSPRPGRFGNSQAKIRQIQQKFHWPSTARLGFAQERVRGKCLFAFCPLRCGTVGNRLAESWRIELSAVLKTLDNEFRVRSVERFRPKGLLAVSLHSGLAETRFEQS